jgi:aldehyde:ferredoxin oxidoreductase
MPLSRVGSLEFIEALTRMIALRQGIGDLLADGIRSAAKTLGHKYEDLITDYVAKTGEMQVYDPRLYLTTGILWAMETRLPIAQLHEISRPLIMWAAKVSGEDFMGLPIADNYVTTDVVREIAQLFWGSEIAADFSTYEGKALAALKIQNRQALQESLILCDMSWPIFHSPNTKDHLGDPDLARKIYSTITGNDIDEAAWDIFAERIFNICRANHLKDGRKGRREDALEEFHFTTGLKTDFANEKCIVPGKEGEVLSRKGMTVDRNLFEKMKDEYYSLRNWDVETGLPTKACLEGLDLKEVAQLY